ncbi:hypothetical protein CH272_13445 [Rhodococcus sp. 05-340-1]|uniref:non-canonical purine NTP pyrophosphatase n=1 Tax=unclassified Rhodococcus (in: high G+C Gram-positive bacteria) TaxID=192944 RepID=UPI000B9A4B2C|nr:MULTISPECIES: non-canonical purine NTP pyrophosphatase [unclassified Rhodococcus (in: high G+C Gram-positive bacteria)]OZD64252.1 hypothetical protein CH271_21910 [Rhodococcus sp. 05-340-2]OZD76667.1 hypothetical protein CH272_13445 [Rhodococcus sp. 05-340-1]
MARPERRAIFGSAEKRPVLVFFTSSRSKYAQAKMLLESCGLRLTYRSRDSEEYDESYSGSKEELLEGGIKQIERRGGANGSYFFIEDTTVRIDALSGSKDTPGLETKEWFERTNFEQLDAELKKFGSRSVTVKSCIALYIPTINRIEYFYGETSGLIAGRPFVGDTREIYSWLTGDNFNRWFIPDGATKTLSEMDYEESLPFDFRAKSLAKLVDRMEEYSIALNASTAMYVRKARVPEEQQGLFDFGASVTVVVGPTCAGKTTFGHYAQHHFEADFIDASDIVRLMQERKGRTMEDISSFSHDLLSTEGPDVVARYISDTYLESSIDGPVVITGFRAIEELEYIRSRHHKLSVVSIEAPSRIRFERYIRRNSRRVINSYTEFQLHDEAQHRLGLLRVASDLSDKRILNVGDEDSFFAQISTALGGATGPTKGVSKVSSRLDPEKSQLYRCLAVLRSSGRPLTTQELEHSFDVSKFVRYNNANKILKRYPELATRQESIGSNIRYQITPQGLAFLGAVDGLNRAPA